MKIRKKLSDFAYSIFPFTKGSKKLLHFLHFKLMIDLLVTCLIIKIFFGILVNNTFLNVKLNISGPGLI